MGGQWMCASLAVVIVDGAHRHIEPPCGRLAEWERGGPWHSLYLSDHVQTYWGAVYFRLT